MNQASVDSPLIMPYRNLISTVLLYMRQMFRVRSMKTSMKTDRIDAAKLARALKKGEILRPVYIRERNNIDDRAVLRVRKSIQRQLAANKARVKHLLHNNGVKIPMQFLKSKNTYWSRAFIHWLQNDVTLLSSTRVSLDLLIKQVLTMRSTLLEASRELRKLSVSDRY